jgi:hypothetical protein
MDGVLAVSSTFTAPFLGRWLDHEEAKRVAEWAARIVLSHLLCPADGVDLTDENRVRRLVRTFVLPGARADTTGTERHTDTGRRTGTGLRTDAGRADTFIRATRTTKGEAS